MTSSPPFRALPACLLVFASCTTVGVNYEEQPYAIVEPTIAYEMILDNKQIVVLDIRPVEEFYGQLGHIAGALSVPIQKIDSRIGEIMPYRSQTVLVYGDAQEEVVQAIETLNAAGFRNLVLIRGGIRRWIDLGYKTVKGI
ncbi:MAG: rhodanese-like domain-containing protein [Acidobacteria bacterium]|nr:rhodanese-like domain-containing protein [Acidobacteriota bacterium]